MISAVAARKLAQVASQERPITQKELVEESSSSESSEKEIVTPSKRKCSSQIPRRSKRKKKERKAGRTLRYFSVDPVKEQDVIAIDSDDENDSIFSTFSGISGDDDPQPVIVSSRKAWSPSAPLDSSDDEAGTLALPYEAPPLPVTEAPVVLSTFQPTVNQNAFSVDSDCVTAIGIPFTAGGTVIALRSSETICLLGRYSFCVLQGTIAVFGVHIGSSFRKYPVYAPRSSPIPVMEGVDCESTILTDTARLPECLQSLTKEPVSLVLIQELSNGIEGLGNVCRTFQGVFEPSRLQKSGPNPLFGVTGAYMITHQTKEIRAFELLPSWARAVSSPPKNESTGVHLIKGPRKSGKSTFARTLMNRLLSRYKKVAYLECDLGQSEFTPAGMVAINIVERPCFGPPFSHPTLPNRAHYIGATNPRLSPSHYLAALQSVLEWYRLDVQNPLVSEVSDDDHRISDSIPLVINTMGWHKGLGADLTKKIVDMAEPTEIYEIEAPSFDDHLTFRNAPSFDSTAKVHRLQPIESSTLSDYYTPADHRSLSILSYFHAKFPSSLTGELDQITATTWDTSLPLCARPPYQVDWSKVFDKVVFVGAGMEDVVPSEVSLVLNGALVALVACDPRTVDVDDTTSAVGQVPYTQGLPAPSPAASQCFGLALIRSMPLTSTHMHILTPLPRPILEKSNVIVKGELGMPIWGMLDHRGDGKDVAGVERGKVPYLQWGRGEGVGDIRRRIRKNLMRKSQM